MKQNTVSFETSHYVSIMPFLLWCVFPFECSSDVAMETYHVMILQLHVLKCQVWEDIYLERIAGYGRFLFISST